MVKVTGADIRAVAWPCIHIFHRPTHFFLIQPTGTVLTRKGSHFFRWGRKVGWFRSVCEVVLLEGIEEGDVFELLSLRRDLLRRQRALEQFEILRHHRVAVFRGHIDACGADGSALVDSTQLVQRLSPGIVGG